ncbi:MAG: hypothetical protein IT364_06800 [Candidatus Hydrogenedentes bacterium]|nr:hypothetical protein [Candidatus Hydrogenedentota bacterium]
MTRRDMMGVIVLIALFVVLTVVVIFTTRPKGDPAKKSVEPEDSFFVQQRIRNLQKSKQ